MKKKTGLYMDFSEFDKGFEKYLKKHKTESAAALEKVAAFVLADAVSEQPTVPKKSGTLRREQAIGEAQIGRKGISIVFGFNTEYAARLHEAPTNWNWSEPGSGPKYLQSKLEKNMRKYMKKVAEYIKEAMQ